MSKINPLYTRWDVKYFRNLHRARMKLIDKPSVSYPSFYERLQKGMSLKEAIYTPSNRNMARYNMKHETKTQKLKEKLATKRIRFISLFKKWSPVNPAEKKSPKE